jgi:hypothetical protein
MCQLTKNQRHLKPVSLLAVKYVAAQVRACPHVTQPLGYWI